MAALRDGPARGYTLIELLAVMAIIGLTIGLVIARSDSIVPQFEIQREAGDMAQTLRDARNRAIISDRVIRMEVDAQNREMRYYYDEPAPDEDPLTFSSAQPFTVRTWGERITLDHSCIGRDVVSANEVLVLKFWPEGVCTPVRLYLQHVKSSGLQYTVQLNPLTGLTDVTRGFVEPEFYEVKPTTPTGVTPTAMPSGQAPSSSRPTSSAQPAATPKK